MLVAVSIPIFMSQLEKAREATDLANMRDAYAIIAADILAPDSSITNNDTNYIKYTAAVLDASGNITTPASAEVTMTQTVNDWTTAGANCAGKDISTDKVKKGSKYTVTVNKDTGAAVVTLGT